VRYATIRLIQITMYDAMAIPSTTASLLTAHVTPTIVLARMDKMNVAKRALDLLYQDEMHVALGKCTYL
jgi:hypothetical protein